MWLLKRRFAMRSETSEQNGRQKVAAMPRKVPCKLWTKMPRLMLYEQVGEDLQCCKPTSPQARKADIPLSVTLAQIVHRLQPLLAIHAHYLPCYTVHTLGGGGNTRGAGDKHVLAAATPSRT